MDDIIKLISFCIIAALVIVFAGVSIASYIGPKENTTGNIELIKAAIDNQSNQVLARDYQIEITEDSTYIFDDDRLVGVIPFDENARIDSIFLKDNQ